MIKYGLKSRRAYAHLMSGYNDIDVYVEDSTYVGVYEKIINRALRGKSKVERVIPLGPRETVLSEAMNDNGPGGRPRLYVVDGDLDLIAFKRRVSAKRLYRLNVYCLENLVWEKAALDAYSSYAMPAQTAGGAIARINYAEIQNEVDNVLGAYFQLLAIARRLNLRGGVYAINPPSVSREENGRWIGADPRKTKNRIRQIAQAIRTEVGNNRYRLVKAVVRKVTSEKGVRGIHYVSGKSFAIWYLTNRSVCRGGLNLEKRAAVSFLADYCKLEMDPRFARRLRKVARTP